ncbi:MAG: cytochrome-c oxidase, cbb3-type subunit III [Pseudomonadota bacterium]|nr:cytochrome-c oxidase, cbb3-type subunit III [Pseudomonadota bacterium]
MSEHDQERERDAHSGTATTGHEWDGIKELDTPLPRWWLWIFYASIAWSVVYMILMPAWPALPGLAGETDHTRGLRDHSERANVAVAMEELEAMRASGFAALEGASIDEIENDPQLLGFVRAAGEAAFGDNCATCHGSGAQGAIGYPNLNDDIWLWGGTYEDIRTTLRYGIRAEHPDTRFSLMPAFGRDELLSSAEIENVADYVLSLSGRAGDAGAEALAAGQETYEIQCASCHMPDGSGDRMQGAPNLADQNWLYGSDREQVIGIIHRGPAGVMPAWEGRLGDATIDALAAYVYLLGGGEEVETAANRPTGR